MIGHYPILVWCHRSVRDQRQKNINIEGTRDFMTCRELTRMEENAKINGDRNYTERP